MFPDDMITCPVQTHVCGPAQQRAQQHLNDFNYLAVPDIQRRLISSIDSVFIVRLYACPVEGDTHAWLGHVEAPYIMDIACLHPHWPKNYGVGEPCAVMPAT